MAFGPGQQVLIMSPFSIHPSRFQNGSVPDVSLRVEARFTGYFAEISPNGRYTAYKSNESGHDEIYVRPFPQVESGMWRISSRGGSRPVWAANGRELFYLDGSNSLTAVPVSTSGRTFAQGRPVQLLDTKYVEPNFARYYDVSPDGQRFLMVKDGAPVDLNQTPATMVVVLNWFEELKQHVSVNGK